MVNDRENLVLVNAFYTNSIILKGLIDYLGETFDVHFIDLPGFSRDSPPLEEISLENFVRHVRGRLDEWRLDHFILGGISFGFLVANALPPDGRCRGLVAITPMIGDRSLKLPALKRQAYIGVTSFFASTGLARRAWNTKALRRLAHWYSHYPPERVDLILDHMDGRTFFETGRLLLRRTPLCSFHDLPYVLITSRNDKTIDTAFVVRNFRERVKRLLIVDTGIDHYPENTTRDYFRDHFGIADLDRAWAFIRGQGSRGS